MDPGRESERSPNAMGGSGGNLLGRYVSVCTYDLTASKTSSPE